MDDFCLPRIGVEISGHAVVEAHADGDEQVALVGHHVGCQIAVHAQHAHVQGMVGGQCAQSQQRASGGQLSFLKQLAQLLGGTCQLHALSHQHQGLHALVDEGGGALYHVLAGNGHGTIGTDEIHVCRFVVHHACLGVLRKVEHHGTGTTAACDVERAAHSPGNVLGTAYLISPLGDGLRDADHVHFLKCVCSQHGSSHLSADDHHGRGVHHGIGNACDGVHRTGSAGHNDRSHASAHAGIALRGVHCRLFVANQDVVQRFFVVVKRIVGGHDGTAGISEQRFHALVLEAAHQGFCARYFLTHIQFSSNAFSRINCFFQSIMRTPPLSALATLCA